MLLSQRKNQVAINSNTGHRQFATMLARLAARSVRPRLVAQATRQVPARARSTAPNTPIDAHHAQSFEVWKKVTVGGCIAVVLSGIYAFAGSHHHHHSPEYSYLRIRTKAYTWRCPDCTLFDGACWEKCDKEGR